MPKTYDIYLSTHAIKFLGTPHRGNASADWGELGRKVASAVGVDTNTRLIKSLSKSSGELDIMCEEFSVLLRQPGKIIRIHTFQEAQGMGKAGKVGSLLFFLQSE